MRKCACARWLEPGWSFLVKLVFTKFPISKFFQGFSNLFLVIFQDSLLKHKSIHLEKKKIRKKMEKVINNWTEKKIESNYSLSTQETLENVCHLKLNYTGLIKNHEIYIIHNIWKLIILDGWCLISLTNENYILVWDSVLTHYFSNY